jgi:membrane-associated phospholipid phosphatase
MKIQPKTYWQRLPEGKYTALFILTACIIFILIAVSVFISGETRLDENMFAWTAQHVSAANTRFMKFISLLGNHRFLIPANFIIIFYFLFRKRKDDAWRVFVVALSSVLFMSLLKRLFQRTRPLEPLVEGITNFSFPSGHAFMSISFYGLIIYFIGRDSKNHSFRNTLFAFIVLLVLLVGFSRIYLRVHYLSDVLAGFAAGIAWLILTVYVCNKFLLQQNK